MIKNALMNLKNVLKKLGVAKLKHLLEKFFYSVLAIFVYMALGLVRLFTGKKIIFYALYNNRIGGLTGNTELLLRRIKNKIHPFYDKKSISVGYCYHFPMHATNYQLLSMYKRVFPIIENRLFRNVAKTWLEKTDYFCESPLRSNEYYEFNNFDPVLTFTPEEKSLGVRLLSQMGIKEDDWFVCFHARDSKYFGKGSHNDFRDCDIDNYLNAAEYIVQQGGYAVRMGAKVEKELPQKRHPHIIDYATDYRSDFMDIYLAAHCKFFLGCTAGILLASTIFNVPAACTNYVPLEITPFRKGDLFIPKKYWSIKNRKFLKFKEVLDLDAGFFETSNEFKRVGLEVIENSADEIVELTKEMCARLAGNYDCSDDEEELHERFINLFKPQHHCYGTPARICVQFLKANKELLCDEMSVESIVQ